MKYFFIFLFFPFTVLAQSSKDKFLGNINVQWLDDGRSMKLLNEFGYKDPNGKQWNVPKNTIVDGASIPQVFWSTIGGPYEGRYRNASVIHDYYCVIKTETWQNVHLMFYNACITGGTSTVKAKLMYAAVYSGGPRWKIYTQKNLDGSDLKIIQEKQTVASHYKFEEITDWIESTNPSLEAINEKLNGIVVEVDK